MRRTLALLLLVPLCLSPALAQGTSTVYVVHAPGVRWSPYVAARIAGTVLGYIPAPEVSSPELEKLMEAVKSLPPDQAKKLLESLPDVMRSLAERRVAPRQVRLRVILLRGADLPGFVRELVSARLGIQAEVKRGNLPLAPIVAGEDWYFMPPSLLREGFANAMPTWRSISDAWALLR